MRSESAEAYCDKLQRVAEENIDHFAFFFGAVHAGACEARPNIGFGRRPYEDTRQHISANAFRVRRCPKPIECQPNQGLSVCRSLILALPSRRDTAPQRQANTDNCNEQQKTPDHSCRSITSRMWLCAAPAS